MLFCFHQNKNPEPQCFLLHVLKLPQRPFSHTHVLCCTRQQPHTNEPSPEGCCCDTRGVTPEPFPVWPGVRQKGVRSRRLSPNDWAGICVWDRQDQTARKRVFVLVDVRRAAYERGLCRKVGWTRQQRGCLVPWPWECECAWMHLKKGEAGRQTGELVVYRRKMIHIGF